MFRSNRELLYQQARRWQSQFQLYRQSVVAVHPEDIDVTRQVCLLMPPGLGQDLHRPDAGDPEQFDLLIFVTIR